MTTKSPDDIYGNVNGIEDVRVIDRKIRGEMAGVRSQEQLTELKKRSDYLCTLSYSPAWKKRFGTKRGRILEVAKEENERTARKANTVARQKRFDVEYHAWGSGGA